VLDRQVGFLPSTRSVTPIFTEVSERDATMLGELPSA